MDYDMVLASSRDMDLEGSMCLDRDFPVTMEERRRNHLCAQLLDLISDSVMTFKPSKSLGSLMEARDYTAPAVEIDVVVSGGGLKGYFITGCSHILKKELAKQNVKIARVAGASAGAWCGLFMLCNLETEVWIETYYKCQELPHMTMHEAYTEIWPWIKSHLPENAWEICNGRLFISVTEVTLTGFKNHMISEYTCNEDIFEACLASSTVPYISLPTMLRTFRGMWVLDGGVTNNTPVFPDHVRRQLVFRLGDVFYPFKFLINPHDKCIEALVVRGAILMSRFLQGEESDSFAWLNPSGYIDSVRERSGLRDWQATNREDNQAVVRRQAWRGLWATAAVATLTCGGILLYRKDREVRNTLSYLLQNLKLSTWRLRLF